MRRGLSAALLSTVVLAGLLVMHAGLDASAVAAHVAATDLGPTSPAAPALPGHQGHGPHDLHRSPAGTRASEPNRSAPMPPVDGTHDHLLVACTLALLVAVAAAVLDRLGTDGSRLLRRVVPVLGLVSGPIDRRPPPPRIALCTLRC